MLPNDKKSQLLCQLRMSEEEEILIKDKKKAFSYSTTVLITLSDAFADKISNVK